MNINDLTLIYTIDGRFNVSKTMKVNGLTQKRHAGQLHAWAIENNVPRINTNPCGQKGMRYIGDTKDFYLPAVYEIICVATNRRYIGSSVRPDLRRATHLFWLKNIDVDGGSNIFYKNQILKEDVKAHGLDSFEMRIIERCDKDISLAALKAREEELIAACEHAMYNKSVTFGVASGTLRIFQGEDPTMVSYIVEVNAHHARLREIKKEYDETWQMKRAMKDAWTDMVKDGDLSIKQYNRLVEGLPKTSHLSHERSDIEKDLLRLRDLIRHRRGGI